MTRFQTEKYIFWLVMGIKDKRHDLNGEYYGMDGWIWEWMVVMAGWIILYFMAVYHYYI